MTNFLEDKIITRFRSPTKITTNNDKSFMFQIMFLWPLYVSNKELCYTTPIIVSHEGMDWLSPVTRTSCKLLRKLWVKRRIFGIVRLSMHYGLTHGYHQSQYPFETSSLEKDPWEKAHGFFHCIIIIVDLRRQVVMGAPSLHSPDDKVKEVLLSGRSIERCNTI